MIFLANENFPYPSIRILRENGFTVISISEDKGISDEEVLKKAVEEKLVILTFDRDYGELIFRFQKEKPPAVVYFRVKGKTPRDAADKLISFIHEGLAVENYFTVVEETGIRQRRLH
ncbi:hypothetical protein BH24BAC1_BH24BAC1_27040 [soil metagenome]